MAGHHLDQFSRLKMLFHVIGWDLDHAEACEATGDVGLGAVDSDPPAQRNPMQLPLLQPLPILNTAAGQRSIIDRPVISQIFRRAWRAMPRHTGWADDVDQ